MSQSVAHALMEVQHSERQATCPHGPQVFQKNITLGKILTDLGCSGMQQQDRLVILSVLRNDMQPAESDLMAEGRGQLHVLA